MALPGAIFFENGHTGKEFCLKNSTCRKLFA